MIVLAKRFQVFLAHQVHKIIPELVDIVTEKDNGYPQLNELYTMNHDGLSAVVISAINEQQEQVNLLRQMNAQLREKIEGLKKLKR